MSKVAIKGAVGGTATFTIESPATNTDRVLVLPDNAGTILTTATTTGINASALSTGTVAPARLGSGTADNTTFLRGDSTYQTIASPTIASTAEAQAGTNNTNFITPLRMREGFNASGSAPVYACRAWVNFNGTGTVAIRASGNVSSITDNGVGDYTVNFSTAMADANYSFVGVLHDTTNVSSGNNGLVLTGKNNVAPTVSALRIQAAAASGFAGFDIPSINVAIFR